MDFVRKYAWHNDIQTRKMIDGASRRQSFLVFMFKRTRFLVARRSRATKNLVLLNIKTRRMIDGAKRRQSFFLFEYRYAMHTT